MRVGKGRAVLGGWIAAVALAGALLIAADGRAALLVGTNGNDVLIGSDDDSTDNPAIQPPGTAADQSLSKADVLIGFGGDDLLIGLLGDDVLSGGPGDDVLVGGTEQGTRPNSDIQFGDGGNDVAVWAGGDGSDAYFGGPGTDAIVFAVIDRDAANVPNVRLVNFGFGERPIVTANLAGAPGFCRIDPAPPESGYDFLVRFVRRADNVLLVTVRVQDVEQVFCAGQAGGGVEWANLADYQGELRPISLQSVASLNPLVGSMVR